MRNNIANLRIALLLAGLAVAPLAGAQVIVDEDFESYNNDSELYGVWPDTPANANGILTSSPGALVPPEAFPNGGQGVDHLGGNAMIYAPDFPNGDLIIPSATESIVVRGDIYTLNSPANNWRQTIGLRSNAPANLLELGLYNAADGTNFEGVVDDNGNPVIPAFAFRTVLFGGGALNWQYIEFDPAVVAALDNDGNGVISPGDVGDDWHTWQATLDEDSITVQIDLFRDGLVNNVATSLAADFNGDEVVDAADFTIWRDNQGTVDATPSQGDATGDGLVDEADYAEWESTFGATTGGELQPGWDATVVLEGISYNAAGFNEIRIGGPSGISSPNAAGYDNIYLEVVDTSVPQLNAGAAVPEPGSLALGGLGAFLAWGGLRRRRV